MKKEDLRKAKMTLHSDGSGDYTIDILFHGWGNLPIPQDNGIDIPATVAIVELQSGVIELVKPKRIKFID